MKTLERPDDSTTEQVDRPRRRRRPGRRAAPAGRVFVVMMVGLLLWSLLAAPSLKRSAEAAPDGARRSASLAVLSPLAAISDATRLSVVSDGLQRAMGRDPDAPPGGELFAEAPDAIPTDFGVAPGVVGTPDPLPEIDPDDDDDDEDVLEEAFVLREPTSADKLRVVVVGDSLAMGLSTAIARAFKPTLVQFVDQGRLSTGLARADYFDWVSGMEQITERFQPDVVVVLIGVNDDQSIIYPSGRIIPGGGQDWTDAYEQRIDEFLAAATKLGGRVVWVGLPPLADEGDDDLARGYSESYENEVEDYAGTAFFDTYERFSRGGGYAPFGRDARGDIAQLRGGDGVHFTPTGYDALAREVIDVMRERWALTPSAIQD